ncbi:hypothetical protein JCM24511_05498 [Saitozyma sp. JCM 24511]|nr:hypothetical protein JCM24511_05498 [Saitozyma sp. JCM 24511]
MTASTAFFIPDTSPLLSYSPCAECASGWIAAYYTRADGYDQTFHEASSISNGSTVAFNITASSLSFVTDAATLCSGSYSINGSGFSSACDNALNSLPGGTHQVIFQSNTSTTTSTSAAGSGSDSTIEFRFYGVSGTVDSSSSSSPSLSNVTLDDTSFGFSSEWDHVVNGSTIGATTANETAAESVQTEQGWYNSSASVTTAFGASANLTFTGETVYLYGATGPAGGEAEVYLDGQLRSTLDLSGPWFASSSLLFMAGGMNGSDTHNLSIVSTGASGQVVLDYAIVTRLADSTTPKNLILILICSAGGVILLLAISVLLYTLLTRRSSRRSQRHPYGNGNGGFTGLSSNDLGSKSSFAGWRKCAETDIGNGPHSPITPLSLSGPTFPLPVKSTPLTGSGSGSGSARGPGAYGQPNGSPPPDYPEYIPYNGPVQALSPPSSAEPPTPPAIAGGSASALSWLKRANSGPHESGPGGSSERLVRPGSSQSYQVELHRQGSTSRSHSHSHSSFSSETSGSLALAHVGTAQAVGVGATRSVARLWPSRSAVPSDFLERDGNNERYGLSAGVSENKSHDAHRAQPQPGHTRGMDPPRPPPLSLASSVQTTAGGSGGALGSTSTLPTSSLSDPTPNGGTTMGGSHHQNQSQNQMTLSSSNYRYDYNYYHNQAQARGQHNPASAIYRHPTSNPHAYPYPNANSKTNTNDIHLAPSDPSASASASFSTPLPSSSVGSVLRRGVSVKSVKTMRSFFSGLLTANPVRSGFSSGSGVPPTPMTSSSREMYPHQYAARPDSDIFPSTLQRSDSTGRMWISPVRRDAVGAGRVSRGSGDKGWDGASERGPGIGAGAGTERIRTPTTAIEGLRTGLPELSGVSGISVSSYPNRSPGSGSGIGSGSGSGSGVARGGRTSRNILPIRPIQPIRSGQADEDNHRNGHRDDGHTLAHAPVHVHDESPAKWVIELDPNSPITASRPGSEMTAYTSGR